MDRFPRTTASVPGAEVLEALRITKEITGLSSEDIIIKSGYTHNGFWGAAGMRQCARRMKYAIYGVAFLDAPREARIEPQYEMKETISTEAMKKLEMIKNILEF